MIIGNIMPIYAEEIVEQANDAATYVYAHPSKNGRLHVKGSQLVDQNDKPVQLKGLSTHGIAWFPGYVNNTYFNELRYDWNANVVRIALYTDEYAGYCNGGNQTDLKNLVKSGIQYATDNDLYVIVDWHILRDTNPKTNQTSAVSFFDEFSKAYKNYNNIIYEICNEPNGNTTWKDVKEYANTVIPVIRKNDSNAVIIVGTPNWSQDIDVAYEDQLNYSNIMYALHFYAATHTDWLRNRMKNMIDSGLPVFVSEYGICDSSGSGNIDYKQASQWIQDMDAYGVSFCMWNISNNYETSAIFNSNCSKTSGFTQDDLSESGKWVYSLLQAQPKETIDTSYNVSVDGYSLTLSDEVGINYYCQFDDKAIANQPTMVFSNGQSMEFSQTTKKDNYYVYTCKVSFKDMTQPISGVLYVGNQPISQEYTYSANQYANYILNHSNTNSKEYKIVKAMLTCGYYAQKYFDYRMDLANSIQYEINALNPMDFSSYAYVENPSDDVKLVGARLVLSSVCQLKLYFRGNGNFNVDGAYVPTTEENGMRVITISNISDVKKMYWIQNGNYTLSFSALSYANMANEQSLNEFMYALYAYQEVLHIS